MIPWIHAQLLRPDLANDLLQVLKEIGFFIDDSPDSTASLLYKYGGNPSLVIADFQNTDLWPKVPTLRVSDESRASSQEIPGETLFQYSCWHLSDLFALLQDRMPVSDLSTDVMVGDWIEFRIASGRDIFNSTRRLFRELLEHSLMDKTSLYHIHHAICEVLINAMEHGNGFDASKQVNCSWVLFQDRMIIKIVDQGSGFVMSQLSNTLAEPFLEAEKRNRQGKRPGGYGLALARQWMDIQFSEQGNTVILTKVF